MSNDKKITQDGYKPKEQERGDQPQVNKYNEHNIQGGYSPTLSSDTTTNSPQPPDEE